ncbi:MAG: hypothetical protein WCI74_00950 [Actinomycetes bacterium]
MTARFCVRGGGTLRLGACRCPGVVAVGRIDPKAGDVAWATASDSIVVRWVLTGDPAAVAAAVGPVVEPSTSATATAPMIAAQPRAGAQPRALMSRNTTANF